MEKLPICRICLADNVRMYLVVNRNLHELYEKLTDIPFVTDNRRPILACFICCAKLKQCYQLLRQCLEAEELLAQIINEDYETNPLINQDHLKFYNGFIKTPIEHISILDDFQTERIDIKHELPAVCKGLDGIEPNEEPQNDELEPENLDNCCLDVADIQPHSSESDLEDVVPLMEFKTEGEEEHEVSEKKRRAREKTRATVAMNPKLDTRRTKEKDAITAEQMSKDKPDSRTTQKPGTYFKEPYTCDQRSFSEKHYNCDVCQRSFKQKSHLLLHISIHNSKVTLTTQKPGTYFKEPYKCDRRTFSGNRYKCDVCQRSFEQKSHLLLHISIHNSKVEKSYKCDVCQRSFGRKGSLSTHIRRHT